MVILFFIRVPLQIAWQIYSFSLMASITTQYPRIFPFGASQTFWIAYGIYVFLIFLISFAYYVFFVGKYGATPGKMAVKLRIVRSDRSKVSYWLADTLYFSQTFNTFTLFLTYFTPSFNTAQITFSN